VSNINNPGEAMREVMATLRVHGYGADEVSSVESIKADEFVVTGNLTKIESGKHVGMFNARIDRGGNEVITAGAFGKIEAGVMDVFHGL
jgi:hypothetical protein